MSDRVVGMYFVVRYLYFLCFLELPQFCNNTMFSLDFKLCIELSKKYFRFSIFLFINKKVEITQNLWSMIFKDKKEK